MVLVRIATGSHSRRTLVRRAMAVAVLAAAGSSGHILASPSHPATWRTWLLDAGDVLRPPGTGEPSRGEHSELLALQAKRTASTAANVAKWGDGPALLPWTNLALDLIRLHRPSP